MGSARFEEIVEDLASDEHDSDEEEQVIRKIEAQQELVRAEIESGLRRQIPVEGVLLPKNSGTKDLQADSSWITVRDTSWVKPNDLFGRTYFLKIDTGLTIWPVKIRACGAS